MLARRSLALLVLLGCCAPLAADETSPPAPVDPAPLVAATHGLACDLYRHLSRREGNLCFSPYSVAISLAMAREGARGETRDEMTRVLRLPEGDAGLLHDALRGRLEPGKVEHYSESGAKVEVPAYEWALANRLFHQEGLALLPAFLATLRDRYRAPPEAVGFEADPEAARAHINRWVAGATRERIVDLLAPGTVDGLTAIALVNAVYLKASWQEPFREDATAEREFRAAAGPVKVPFLRRTGDYGTAETERARVAEIPYAGGALSMVIILPAPETPLRELEETLDAASLKSLLGRIEERFLELEVPKFRFRSPFDLGEPLRELGMRIAFSEKADFRGIAVVEAPLFIGPVAHQGYIAVDEKGTEAAAATAVILSLAEELGPPVPFVVDRPFLFLIRHRETGTILFLGRVADPSKG